MTQRILKMFCVFAVLVSSNLVHATDELSGDLSLDEAFNSATPASPAAGANPMTSIVPNESSSALPGEMQTSDAANPMLDMVGPENRDRQLTATTTGDEVENVNLASLKELHQRENALYGFSVGLMGSSQPFAEEYDIKHTSPKTTTSGTIYVENGTKQSIKQQTNDIQNFGVIARYAIVPFYSLGTDLNISYMRSQNHSSIYVKDQKTRLSEITTLRGELNFTYAVDLGGGLPVYFLAGIGAQKVSGSVIEKIVNSMGYGGQVGIGCVFASIISVEGVYSYYAHRISNTIVDEQSLSAPALIDTQTVRTINEGLIVRSSYNFDF